MVGLKKECLKIVPEELVERVGKRGTTTRKRTISGSGVSSEVNGLVDDS